MYRLDGDAALLRSSVKEGPPADEGSPCSHVPGIRISTAVTDTMTKATREGGVCFSLQLSGPSLSLREARAGSPGRTLGAGERRGHGGTLLMTTHGLAPCVWSAWLLENTVHPTGPGLAPPSSLSLHIIQWSDNALPDRLAERITL